MGFPSSGIRDGAILDPAEAPTTTPTSEKTPARKPVLAPRSITATTKSAINTSRKLRPASSIDRFYRRCKAFTAPGRLFSVSQDVRAVPGDLCTGSPRYNLSTMDAAEFLP